MEFTTPLEGALWCVSQGFRVFPLEVGGKLPVLTGWQKKAAATPADVATLSKAFPSCNWGVSCGLSGLVVLDVDVKDGKVGADSLDKLEEEHGHLPATLEVSTPTDGLHCYFLGKAPNSQSVVGPDLDIRGEGGFVVAPGSDIGGVKYRIVSPSANKVAVCPQWLLDAAGAGPRAEKKKKTVGADTLDTSSQLSAARTYLQTCPPAIEGEGGDEHTYKVLQHALDLGASPASCLELALLHFNPRCLPPWDDEDLEKKVENASKYRQNAPGCRSLEAILPPLPAESGAIRRLPPFLDGGDLAEFDPPPQVPFIHGVCEMASAISVFGKSKTKKSFTAAQLAVCAASGTAFGPWLVRRGKVLFFDSELRPGTIHRRINDCARMLGIHHSTLRGWLKVCPLRGLRPDLAWASEIVDRAKEMGAILVAFDSLYSWMPESEDIEAQAALNCFEEVIRTRTGASTLTVRHDTKGDVSQKALVDRGSGHGSATRHLDAGMAIDISEDETDRENPTMFVWRWLGRDYKMPPATPMMFSNGAFFLGDHSKDPGAAGRNPSDVALENKALAVMAANGNLGITEAYGLFQTSSGVGEKAAKRIFKGLVESGKILRVIISDRPRKEGFSLPDFLG